VISNPLADPLFLATSQVVGSILLAGFLLLLVAEHRHLQHLHRRVLFQRWAVWAVIAPVYSVAVLGGVAPMLVLVSLLVGQALREYARLVGLPPLYLAIMLAMGLLMGPLAIWSPLAFYGILPLLLIAATLQPLLTQDVQEGIRWLALAALGFAYVALLLGHVLLIDVWVPSGHGLLLVLGLSIALSDVGAFVAGRLFGRHRLAPVVSPNKTWEGIAGNVIGAYAGAWLMHFAFPVGLVPLVTAALPLVVAIGCVWGDLIESLFKREFGMKDAGTWLPGFGGLLDRIDSLIVVAPLSYYLVRGLI
jgi:phosphatidate cytidylyltransferase